MLYTVINQPVLRCPMSRPATRVDAPSEPTLQPKYRRSDELGNEITELCAYIFAATYQLLEKIRQFDEEGLWQLEGD